MGPNFIQLSGSGLLSAFPQKTPQYDSHVLPQKLLELALNQVLPGMSFPLLMNFEIINPIDKIDMRRGIMSTRLEMPKLQSKWLFERQGFLTSCHGYAMLWQ